MHNLKDTANVVYINGWTQGTIYTGTHVNEPKKAYSELFDSTSDTQVYFDDSIYKICFIAFDDDGVTRTNGSSWKETSPAQHSMGNTKCRAELARIDGSNISITDLLNTVYYNVNGGSGSKLIQTVLELENKANPVYVDCLNGSDSNDGTKENPFATIQKGISTGNHIIYVATGTYNETLTVANRENDLSILPMAYSDFDNSVPDTPMIIVSGGGTRNKALTISDSGNIKIVGVHFDNCLQTIVQAENVKCLEMIHCVVSNNKTDGYSGIELTNVNGTFGDCHAYNIQHDGFNIHGYGHTEFIDCVAHDCGDDGISHHDGSTGLIQGGEYYNCGKGGVSSPTYGAIVDVINVYSHNNTQYGILSASDSESGRRNATGKIIGCVCKNNTLYDIFAKKADLIGWGNIYDTKSIADTATFTEIPSNCETWTFTLSDGSTVTKKVVLV